VTSRIQVYLELFRNGNTAYYPTIDQLFLDYGLIKVDSNKKVVVWVIPRTTFREVVSDISNSSSPTSIS
jgi:hypothetical protein